MKENFKINIWKQKISELKQLKDIREERQKFLKKKDIIKIYYNEE